MGRPQAGKLPPPAINNAELLKVVHVYQSIAIMYFTLVGQFRSTYVIGLAVQKHVQYLYTRHVRLQMLDIGKDHRKAYVWIMP